MFVASVQPAAESKTCRKSKGSSLALDHRLKNWRVQPNNCFFSLGLQIAQSRSHVYTSGPKISVLYILGASGFCPAAKHLAASIVKAVVSELSGLHMPRCTTSAGTICLATPSSVNKPCLRHLSLCCRGGGQQGHGELASLVVVWPAKTRSRFQADSSCSAPLGRCGINEILF